METKCIDVAGTREEKQREEADRSSVLTISVDESMRAEEVEVY
ncbi:hypothetical protein COLO4_05209 [Corchorus olitorius]|uniref:Uncharacterized protein n=1 Tax=Corchorus olitorius TaxID=93759 RepID=A0A1R3KRJ8_9ROSI|nr:hypothetical protein COLO4_05209 [Corchorus olitorius]